MVFGPLRQKKTKGLDYTLCLVRIHYFLCLSRMLCVDMITWMSQCPRTNDLRKMSSMNLYVWPMQICEQHMFNGWRCRITRYLHPCLCSCAPHTELCRIFFYIWSTKKNQKGLCRGQLACGHVKNYAVRVLIGSPPKTNESPCCGSGLWSH